VTESKLRAGQAAIEATIAKMIRERGMTLETPITWRKHSDRDVFTIEASIQGHQCVWNLVAEAIESYIEDLDVRYAIDLHLKTYFIPA
jgi:hypothetical protein